MVKGRIITCCTCSRADIGYVWKQAITINRKITVVTDFDKRNGFKKSLLVIDALLIFI
jgi:hypothetical protein